MRPTAYSGNRSSLAALPEPKEKDATWRAYRAAASFPENQAEQILSLGHRLSSPSVTSISNDSPSRT